MTIQGSGIMNRFTRFVLLSAVALTAVQFLADGSLRASDPEAPSWREVAYRAN